MQTLDPPPYSARLVINDICVYISATTAHGSVGVSEILPQKDSLHFSEGVSLVDGVEADVEHMNCNIICVMSIYTDEYKRWCVQYVIAIS